MASANLFQQYLQPVRSVADYAADMDKAEANKLALVGQRRQNELAALTADQTRQTMADSAADRNALQSLAKTWGAGTSVQDRVAALRNSGRPALMTQADALEKQDLEKQKTGAQVAKDQAEAQAKQAEIKWKLADRHMQRLPLVMTAEDAVAYIDEGIREGTLPAEGRERSLQALQTMGLDKWKATLAQAAIPVLERYKEEAATLRTRMNNETSIKTTQMNNDTSRANTAASNAVQMRGQDKADARARESIASGKVPSGYRQRPDGSLEFIPGGPADPSTAKKAAPTEFQGKSAAFGSRAQEADRILQALDGKYSPAGINTKQGLGRTWLVGGALESAANLGMSPETQKAEQAQRDFINAILRQESGAAIGAGEFDNAAKQYFPQPGDSKAVIQQKAANRKRAVQGLINNAGNATVTPPSGGVVDFGSLK